MALTASHNCYNYGMKDKNIEDKPLYRLFKVLLVLGYVFVFGCTVLAGILGFTERDIESATLVCNDGTRWVADNIVYDNAAKCGLCTKRDVNNSYIDCAYSDSGYYNSYTLEKDYAFPWNLFLYPLIVLVIGLPIVDLIYIAVYYIAVGDVDWSKSLFLKIILTLFSGSGVQKSREQVELESLIQKKKEKLLDYRRRTSFVGKAIMFLAASLITFFVLFIIYFVITDLSLANIGLALLAAVVAGAVIYWFIAAPKKARRKIPELEKEIANLEKDLSDF